MRICAARSNESAAAIHKKMAYTVNDVAKLTGLTPYTIRYYAKEGLLPMVERNQNGTRLFKESDLEMLDLIECLKQCGMSIREIREFAKWTLEGDETIDQRLALFDEKKRVLEQKMEELQDTLDFIKYKKWYYTAAKEAGTIDVHQHMKPEEIPEDIRPILEKIQKKERK